MTVEELILNNSDKVRRDSSLMAFYIQAFFEAFNYKPSCAGCTFNSDWNKLVRFVNKEEKTVTLTNMKNTFQLKKITNSILRFERNGRYVLKYDNMMTEAFAEGFLTHGTAEEIEARKKLFAVLPEKFRKPADNKPTMQNTAKEMKSYAEEKGIDISGLLTKAEILKAITEA